MRGKTIERPIRGYRWSEVDCPLRMGACHAARHGCVKFGWTEPGYEYPLMWGLIMPAIAPRGGGPCSIDRRLGREL